MALFFVRAEIKEAKKEIINYLENNFAESIKCDFKDSSPSKTFIKAKGNFEDFKFRLSCELEDHTDCSFLKLDIYPEIWRQMSLAFRAVLTIDLIILTMVILYFRVFSDLGYSTTLVELAVIMLLFFIGLSVLIDLRIFKKKLCLIEAKIKTYLNEKYDVKIVTPIEAKIFPLWFSIILTILGWYFALAVCFKSLRALFFILFPFAFLFLYHLCIRYFARKKISFAWKLSLLELNYKWLVTNIHIIFVFVFLYIFNVSIFVKYANQDKKIENYKIEKAFSVYYFKPAFERKTTNYVFENINILNIAINGIASNSMSSSVTSSKFGITRAGMLLATGIIIISFLLLGQYKRIINIASYWKLIIGEDKRLYIRQPSIAYFKANNKWPTKLIVIIDYLLAFPINYAAFFISFEAMAYALFNKTIILEKSAILFSWIPASHMLFYNAINIESNLIRDILLIIPKLILIILSFPILFMTLRRIVNIVLDIKNEAYNYFSHIGSIGLIPPELSSFVKELTYKYNIKLPRLIIKNSKMIETNVIANIFKKRSTLVLSKGAIERLNINELKALVAHEMGHIRQGLRKISLAKLLSRMSLSPNYILALSFDFAEMEFDADRFCIEATKDKKAFRDALVRISIINTSSKEMPKKSVLLLNKIFDKILTKRIRTNIENMLASDEFYFGDVLVGYAHPTIMQRIKNIDSL